MVASVTAVRGFLLLVVACYILEAKISYLVLLRAATLDIKSIKQVFPELLCFLLSCLTAGILIVTRKN